MGERTADEVVGALNACRGAEKEQTLFYRALAAAAELRGDAAQAERLNALHADEQHHLSRLTARLIELGGRPSDVSELGVPGADLEGWEAAAREREREEVARYEALLEGPLDRATRRVVEEILESERHHARALAAKGMPA